MREEVEALEYHADFLTHLIDVGLAVEDDAIDADLAGRRLFQVIHAAQQGALAGTGRTDDDHDFLFLDIEVNALQDLHLTE